MPIKFILIAVLCHLAPGHAMACHRETLWQGEDPYEICANADTIVDRWKVRKYDGKDWAVLSYGCKVWSRLS